MENLKPRDRRRQRVRRTFVDAARQIAAEQGPEKLSLREVARVSDYSHAALYEYFQSREDLLGAVIYEGFGELMSHLAAVSDDRPARERLQDMGRAYIEFARQSPEIFELLFTRNRAQRQQVSEVRGTDTPYGLLRSGVAALVPDASEDAIDRAAYSFWALVHGFAMLEISFLSGFEADFDRAHSVSIAQFVETLQRSLEEA
jgi:AcrR family transcriptional regulator